MVSFMSSAPRSWHSSIFIFLFALKLYLTRKLLTTARETHSLIIFLISLQLFLVQKLFQPNYSMKFAPLKDIHQLFNAKLEKELVDQSWWMKATVLHCCKLKLTLHLVANHQKNQNLASERHDCAFGTRKRLFVEKKQL